MKKVLKENIFFTCFCVLIGVYYIYRLFSITPWYDEVYTYLTFIDKGVFYSLTRWPLPNNHVFFSAASALLKPAGIYISLRGISWLAAMGTLILLYGFLKRIFGKWIALTGVMFYTVLLSVNNLAVQGRGYSLATFFFMLALYCVCHILQGKTEKRYYLFMSFSLYLGLYTLVSSVYWVMTVCICGGLILLAAKRYKEFFRMVIYSVLAALMTLVSYSALWLAIGSNRIIDTVAQYQMESHVNMILKHPLMCWLEGIDIMLNNPFVQGVGDRGVFLRDFKFFAQGVLNSFFGIRNAVIWYGFAGIVILAGIWFIVTALKSFCQKKVSGNETKLFALALSGFGFLIVFTVLLVQCAYPFERVFSFLGILFAILFCVTEALVWHFIKKKFYQTKVKYVVNALLVIVCAVLLCSPKYNSEYSGLDYYAYDAIKHIDWSQVSTYCAGDIYAKQQIQYHCILGEGMQLEENLENPQILLMQKNRDTGNWSNLLSETMFEEYGSDNRKVIYENEVYIVYQ